MKSRRMPLVWMVSFLLHACFAVVIGYIAISSKQLKAQDAIDVSFFIVTPPQAAKRDVIAKPAVVATPVPDLRVVPQTETTSRRATLARAARSSATAAPAASLTAGAPAAPRGQQIKVPSRSPVLQHTEQSLSTAAVLPTTSDALPTAGLSSGGITDGLSAGVGDGLGSGTGRGSFGSGSGFGQARTQGSGRLNTLVEGAGAANINASLSDVEQNMVLGNGVPQLPKGSPGAIIQGRGKEIIGRLHLVRLDDPLHPNLDF
ncbi:MAG: hypothetical protein OYL97_14500 [Candidatus Poribacteria bacterium]|nr:hypothetical protein [Candidatus Poribacteria bacterium]